MIKILVFVMLALAALIHPAPAAEAGQVGNPGGLSPAEAQRALEVLKDPQKRAQLIATLEAIAKALPPQAGAKPAAPASVALAPDSLGAQLLVQLSRWAEGVALDAEGAARAVIDFSLLWPQLRQAATDPDERAALADAAWRLVLVLAVAGIAMALAGRWLRRPRALVTAQAPGGDEERDANGSPATPAGGSWGVLQRLPFALAGMALELVPVAVFAAIGTLVAGLVGATPATRLVIIAVVNAYVISRLVLALGHMLLAPDAARLRLVPLGEGEAAWAIRWLWRITVVAIFGGAIAEVAGQLGIGAAAHATLVRLVTLVVAALLVIVVIRSRRRVADAIRAPDDAEARWRNWLAGTWHYFAIVLIIAGWILSAAGPHNGASSLRVLIGTVTVLVVARLLAIVALGTLDRELRLGSELARRWPGIGPRATRYRRPARLVIIAAIVALTAVMLLEVWGVDAFLWFAGDRLGGRLLGALVAIAVAAGAAIIVWEAANAALDRRLARLGTAGSPAQAARLRTLLPILRAALLTAILMIVGLTALSEVGVNIAPLLAGAGIIGIAVGFGSQKLVQDVITGIFVLFENAIQIGDWVTVSGLSGSVEQLSVRTIRLRAADGSVHVVPFSAVTSITNTNRGIGNAAVAVTVAFREDTDRVGAVLAEIAAEMRRDPIYAALMLGDLQLWGVEAVKAAGVTIAG